MKVKLLLVAEIEVGEETQPELSALSQIQDLGESAHVEFYPPAIGRRLEKAGSKSVEVFY